jgi:hypothetical protein
MMTPTKKLRQDGKPFVRWLKLMHEDGLVSALVDAALYYELNIDATEGRFISRELV